MKLSKNFTLEEMTKSDTAIRLGIENIPTHKQIENLKLLATNILQPTRDKFGEYKTTSGYRNVELCNKVGSNGKSYHAKGQAHDGEAADPEISNIEVLIWIAENLEFTELIAEYMDIDDKKAGWVHSAYDKNNIAKVIKLKDRNYDYTIVTLQQLKDYFYKKTII